MRTEPYPSWDYFPRNAGPPGWVEPFVANVRAAEESISTVERKTGLRSDWVLQQLATGLRELGFDVESGKKASDRIRRPVLFGSNGRAEVSYEIDAFHDGHGIVLEVEAGRGARGVHSWGSSCPESVINLQFDPLRASVARIWPVGLRELAAGLLLR